MITDAYNLVEVLAGGFIGACIGGVGVFLATLSVRNDAALDRAEASEDRGKAEAARVAMESARMLLPLHPAYQAHTAQFEMIRADQAEPDAPVEETVPTSELDDMRMPDFVPGQPLPEHQGGPTETETACCTGHGDEPCAQDSGIVPPYCCGNCPDWRPGTDLVPVDAVLVDEPPVTADDLAPIGPDRMPRLTFWGRVALGAAVLPLLVALVLLALAVLARVGWDRAGEWRADRSRRRETEPVEMELAHPAPADAYKPRHLAPAGRWWWSR